MEERVIIKSGQSNAVRSAIEGFNVLWVREMGSGYIAAAVIAHQTEQILRPQQSSNGRLAR